MSNHRTTNDITKNSPNDNTHPQLNILNPSLNTLSVTIIINTIGNKEKTVVNMSISTRFVLKILSNDTTVIRNKKYKIINIVVFALWRRYIFLQKKLVRIFATAQMRSNNKLIGTPRAAIESANRIGLYIPNEENPMTCLKILTTNAPMLRRRIIAMRSIGNQLEIRLSIK